MNKSTKGLIAAAAGVTLLTGVGGTFANWSASDSEAPGSVTAGHLDMTIATGTWTDGGVAIDDISVFKLVPGDEIVYSTTINPDMEGDNLTAELSATLPTPSGDLAADVTVVPAFGTGGTTAQLDEDSVAVPVTVTVTMPFDAKVVGENGSEGEGETLDLSALQVSLTQV